MGKPFNNELMMLKATIEWADQQDIKLLENFLFQHDIQSPLVCIGSGGSLSACYYAALLSKLRNGVLSTSMTPLELIYSGREIIQNSKLLYMSASGKNKDIQNAIKYGVKYNETDMMSLSLHKNNPTELILEKYPKVVRWCEEIPCGKDGFLASNSLLATFALLSRCYNGESVKKDLNFNGRYTSNYDVNLANIHNFIVLYGASGESVAKDLESKLTEAALGATLLSDYRNFGHGRHHWFAKHKEDSCIIALISPVERELATKTIHSLPLDIHVIYIDTEFTLPKSSIEMLIKAFHFVRDLGEVRNIDPGKPGVPQYGSKLYNLNYFKLIDCILPKQNVVDFFVKRKLGATSNYNAELHNYYRKSCISFVQQLNKTKFKALAFDYDGTLSAPDNVSRYNDRLCDNIQYILENILKNNIEIIIVTGRGTSAGRIFRNSINKKYWQRMKIGYYNGACIRNLANDNELNQWKIQPLNNELKVLKEELLQRLPSCSMKYNFAERNLQLSIENETIDLNTEIIFTVCREIILDKKLKNVHVWRSSHSMDVVVFNEVSKLNIIKDNEHTLCIGDYGSIDGNDYELLSCLHSLSVDKVSYNPVNCWNIAPSGMRGLEATLYYLNQLILRDGEFKCKFKI